MRSVVPGEKQSLRQMKESPMSGSMVGRTSPRRARALPGFTLLEMMLVVVIIGILATVVVVNLAGGTGEARKGATVSIISQVKSAITQYFGKHGSYPLSVAQLATGTNPLLEKLPKDAWKRDLVYLTPGIDAGRPYSLYSLGEDGQPNTPDDINVWRLDELE
jgi:general secretion pathway protein G